MSYNPDNYEISLVSRVPTTTFNPSRTAYVNEKFPDFIVRISIREGCNETFTGKEPIRLDNVILKIYDPKKKLDCHTDPDSAGYREIYGLAVVSHAKWKKEHTAQGLSGRKQVTITVDDFIFLQEGYYKVAFSVSLGNVNLGTTGEQPVHAVKSVNPDKHPKGTEGLCDEF